MARRSADELHRSERLDEEAVGEYTDLEESVSEPTEVVLRSLVDTDLTISGPVSGNEYHFPRAGSEVKVASEDKDLLLSKKSVRRVCCGAPPNASKVFELVGG